MTVKEILSALLKNRSISIKGQNKKVVGMARFSSVNHLESDYVKVAFSDKSGIFFPLDDEVVYYFTNKPGQINNVSEEAVFGVADISYNGKSFSPVNENDYQFVKELYVGDISNIEGEVRFSDYESNNGEVLSIAFNFFEGKRDDVYAVPLDSSEIKEK
jgi:hypothetical protein